MFLTIDQGTTSSRALLFDEKGQIIDLFQRDLKQIYPEEGWVEHDPFEILSSTILCCETILNKNKNVLGMMPHPERAAELAHGCEDGKTIFESILN